ncbi:MAG: gliding motility-associated C-terminal domain-containing protein [Sphingobacteriales bacterium]|nr:gliding motility-associated C-terminal domain-containing protein [Sphingobacteriales bacterium]
MTVNAVVDASGAIPEGTTVELAAFATSSLDGALSYQWSPSDDLSCNTCSNPFATPDTTTTYTVVVTDEYGCTASATVVVEVIQALEKIAVAPTAFSPNGDGQNDMFLVSGTSDIKEVEMHLYNRWGNEVFNLTTDNLNDGWDGRYRFLDCEIGVYAYYIYVTFDDGETMLLSGNVTLVR